MLRFRSLGSGSTGNATLVEAFDGTSTTRLLVDCGFGLKQLDTRLAVADIRADQIDAIFITHEHGDHIGSARQFAQRHGTPVWMSAGTHASLGEPDFRGSLRQAQDGVPIEIKGLLLQPFTVPHDAREPLQLTCSDGARRLGILTDLGHSTDHVLTHLTGCDALLLECNHEPDLLARSDYPASLKKRVGGQLGHLSNHQAAEIAGNVSHDKLKHVVAAHLSLQNNHPDLARAAVSLALGCDLADVGVADAVHGTDWVSL